MLNIKELLDKVKASPYREIEIRAPHTGVVEFAGLKKVIRSMAVKANIRKAGTLLGHLTREKNKKPIYAPEKGEVESVAPNWKDSLSKLASFWSLSSITLPARKSSS